MKKIQFGGFQFWNTRCSFRKRLVRLTVADGQMVEVCDHVRECGAESFRHRKLVFTFADHALGLLSQPGYGINRIAHRAASG